MSSICAELNFSVQYSVNRDWSWTSFMLFLWVRFYTVTVSVNNTDIYLHALIRLTGTKCTRCCTWICWHLIRSVTGVIVSWMSTDYVANWISSARTSCQIASVPKSVRCQLIFSLFALQAMATSSCSCHVQDKISESDHANVTNDDGKGEYGIWIWRALTLLWPRPRPRLSMRQAGIRPSWSMSDPHAKQAFLNG